MLTEDRVRELRENLQMLTQFAKKRLVQRQEWGSIDFKQASDDIDSVISIANDLLRLPLKHLTDANAQELRGHIPSVQQCLQSIDDFSIENIDHPGNKKDEILRRLRDRADQLQNAAYRFIPYLVYRHDDEIAEKREKIGQLVKEAEQIQAKAKQIQAKAKQTAETGAKEINYIIRKAKDAAASAGAVAFTAQFETEAKELRNRSRWWLGFTAGLGILTVGAAILFYFWPEVSSDAGPWETLRNVGSKAATIAVLFTGAVWCGGIYRALVHQATVNKHRALSLKTFEAFVKATSTPEVRDAVLLATTNAAFGNVPTGLVEQAAGEGVAVNVTEISKRSVERAMKTRVDASD